MLNSSNTRFISIPFLIFIFFITPNLVHSQTPFDDFFRSEMESKIGAEEFKVFLTDYESRIKIFKSRLVEGYQITEDKVMSNVNFLAYYTRILRWVNSNSIKEPFLQEAKDYLDTFKDQFVDESAKMLDILDNTFAVLEKTQVIFLLKKYEHIIFEITEKESTRKLLNNEEQKVFKRFGISKIEFSREQTNLNKNSKIPTYETVMKVKDNINRQVIEEKKSNITFVNGLVSTFLGLATIIGDSFLLPPSSGLSSCSLTIGGGLFGVGAGIMLSN